MTNPILFGDYIKMGAAESDKMYEELTDMTKLKNVLNDVSQGGGGRDRERGGGEERRKKRNREEERLEGKTKKEGEKEEERGT